MKVIQSCPARCDPIDYIVYGILQVRILEWVAVPSPGDLTNPEIKPRYPTLHADSLPADSPGNPPPAFFSTIAMLFLMHVSHSSIYRKRMRSFLPSSLTT